MTLRLVETLWDKMPYVKTKCRLRTKPAKIGSFSASFYFLCSFLVFWGLLMTVFEPAAFCTYNCPNCAMATVTFWFYKNVYCNKNVMHDVGIAFKNFYLW